MAVMKKPVIGELRVQEVVFPSGRVTYTILHPDGETVINRHELKALLDKLESLDAAESGEPPGQAGEEATAGHPVRTPPTQHAVHRFCRPLSRTAVVHAPDTGSPPSIDTPR